MSIAIGNPEGLYTHWPVLKTFGIGVSIDLLISCILCGTGTVSPENAQTVLAP
ncbi:MAG: hypothetical protein ISR78_02440 [Spirochaetia bacterium]|nr:hypothetical protein [Spirochaetia bacterium]